MDIYELKDFLENVRIFLEPKWKELKNANENMIVTNLESISTDMCRYTSVFLYHLLTEKYPDENWKVQGGETITEYSWPDGCNMEDPGPPDIVIKEHGGFRIWSGKDYSGEDISHWAGHLWLKNDNHIIDLTLDQFRMIDENQQQVQEPSVVITDGNDERYFSNMTEKKLDLAMNLDMDIIEKWLEAWHEEYTSCISMKI